MTRRFLIQRLDEARPLGSLHGMKVTRLADGVSVYGACAKSDNVATAKRLLAQLKCAV